jgi:hypothetical protein
MTTGKCLKLDNCPKIVMILDHDLAGEWQYAESIQAVCTKCPNQQEDSLEDKKSIVKVID